MRGKVSKGTRIALALLVACTAAGILLFQVAQEVRHQWGMGALASAGYTGAAPQDDQYNGIGDADLLYTAVAITVENGQFAGAEPLRDPE